MGIGRVLVDQRQAPARHWETEEAQDAPIRRALLETALRKPRGGPPRELAHAFAHLSVLIARTKIPALGPEAKDCLQRSARTAPLPGVLVELGNIPVTRGQLEVGVKHTEALVLQIEAGGDQFAFAHPVPPTPGARQARSLMGRCFRHLIAARAAPTCHHSPVEWRKVRKK